LIGDHIGIKTGYIRGGGVSPLGLKKKFPTYLDKLAFVYEKTSISAGVKGMQLTLSPTDLQIKTGALITNISRL